MSSSLSIMPLDRRLRFYALTLATAVPDRDARLLVVGGGIRDKAVLAELGFTNVVLSNIDERTPPDAYAPYTWSYQDASALTYPDESFDYVIEHAALHHCPSPHAALLEMFRVARVGVLAIEARDGALMQLLERAGISGRYEPSAVYYNEGSAGGINNTEIPNFIYRWTEREVEKTIATAAPHAPSRIRYFYGHDAPITTRDAQGVGRRLAVAALSPLFRLFVALFPRQQNLFAFAITKPSIPADLHPWLRWDGERPRFNTAWAQARFVPIPREP